MRVRSNSQGSAFSLSVDFDSPFITRVKSNYTLSLYTLVNCPKVGCESAQDSISVQIKEGVTGNFREIYVIKGRVRDDRWIMSKIDFVASQSVLNVYYSLLIPNNRAPYNFFNNI
jgi:hypothetical protein